MTKEELLDQIKDDLNLTEKNLETKLYEIPSLHSKYLRHYFNAKREYNKKKKEFDIKYKAIYNKIQNGNKLLSPKEILFHIYGNEKFADLNHQVQALIDLIDILDRTLKKVNNMSFDVKNLISYKQYLAGTF